MMIIDLGEPVSYATVMLDWAITEANSDRWRAHYAVFVSAPTLAAAATSDDLGSSLTEQQKAELVQGAERVRNPILGRCGLSPSWHFQRCTAESSDLRKFHVLPWWFAGPNIGAEEIRWKRGEGLGSLILDVVANGNPLRGTPIAIATADSSDPMLIEGYLRAGVALRRGDAHFSFYLGGE